MWKTVKITKSRLYGCVTPDDTRDLFQPKRFYETGVLTYEILKDTLVKVRKGRVVYQKQILG